MPEIIDQLAELTGLRDRDTLDVSLALALRDLLAPELVAVHRVVGEPGDERWQTRARLAPTDVTATADTTYFDNGSLPALGEQASWHECLLNNHTVCVAGSPSISLFAMPAESGASGVVEVHTQQPLHDDLIRLVNGVLRIYRNVHALLDYSERDTLTGLLNRKSFDETFYKMVALGMQAAQQVDVTDPERRLAVPVRYWLGVIDIDHFKLVNDTFGHLIGDEVLLLLSRVMRGCFRHSDRLYRFGGEEFVVLLRCPTEEDAHAAMERFRVAVREYKFPQVNHVTISVGFTDLRPGDTPSSAVERADKAVYHAKHHGRDQVCSHSALVSEGLLVQDNRDSDVEFF
ncbi:MAG: GGDEF domain-containing protein [Ideonella sp.]|nr:GGDEF domain-containing protein [Ideonella sp.]